MKIVRWFLGKIILLLDAIFVPKRVTRSAAERKRIQEAVGAYSLYQFEACPFCVKVRRYLKAEGIEIPLRDATKEPARGELVQKGGKLQVPCLRIAGAPDTWLYESSEIVKHFERVVDCAAERFVKN
jgi:glutaredoxin